MSKEIHILFTGVGRRVELIQAFREAALCLDVTMKIYGADMTNTAPALYYCDFYRPVCSMREDFYIDELLIICKNDNIDLVIPTIDTDLLVLSENKNRFEEIGTKVLISSPEMISICRDKNKTSSFFESCGLKAPMPVNDWTLYEDGYPAFIKPKDGSSSINAYKVENEEELQLYASQIDDYVVQPFVDGKEYTIDIFCDWDGNPISIVPRERMQVRAGEVLKTRIDLDPKMIEEARELCKVFKPCGPITVQLIQDRNTGDNYYIEINPRFGGGAPLSMKAGARSCETILNLLLDDDIKEVSEVEDGAIYSRFDQSVCISHGKGKIKGVIFDLDDTLYSEKDYVKSGFRAIGDYLGNTEMIADELWSYFEDGKPAIDCLLIKWNRMDIKDLLLTVYRSHMPDITLYDGVLDTIQALRDKGIRVGVITDGRPEGQRNKIQVLGLQSLVDDIIITDELGGTQFRKPCDISFRIIMKRWKLNPAEVVYVGDNSSKDFQAPQQLGMIGLWFDNKAGIYQENSNYSEYTIRSISNLQDVLLHEGQLNENG